MRLAMSIDYAGGHHASARRVVDLEHAGLDVAWVAEAYSFDAPSFMGYLAALTERVQIGAGILPIYTRSPSLIAMTAAGVDALSDGRCILGLGASGPQVIEGFHGIAYDRPLGRTREIVDICRTIWARVDKLSHDGPIYRVPLPEGEGTGLGKPLKLIPHPVRPTIPVFVAALGERNLELTAEIADGWLPLFFLPERAAEVFGPALAAGAARRDPGLGPIDVCAGGLVAVVDEADAPAVRDLARPRTALYVGGMGAPGRNFYNALVTRYGYGDAAAEVQAHFLAGRRREAEAAVPAELLELTNLVGPVGYVRERIAAYAAAGVTMLTVTPVGDDPVRLVEQVADWVHST